jgi:phosphoglycolate phosphatase
MADAATRRFRLIVFDWDGTLADSTAIIVNAIQYACADIGAAVPAAKDARYIIGLGLADALAHIAPGLSDAGRKALSERYRHHYLAHEDEIHLFDGVLPLLDELAQSGLQLAVATGKTRVGLDRALSKLRLRERFHATRCADEGRPKPHPDMLLHLMDTLVVAPGETLMIGDTTHDLDLARNAGAQGVAVTYGAHDPAGLATRDPLATVHSVAGLRAWLAANG